MIMFQNDYVEGAHPAVLQKLIDTNMEQSVGYGEDPYCEEARARIRKVVGREDVDIHFLVGGTQTNLTVIDAALRRIRVRFARRPDISMFMKPVLLRRAAIKFLLCRASTERLRRRRSKRPMTATGRMERMNIWYSPSWYTSHIRQSLARCIQNRN